MRLSEEQRDWLALTLVPGIGTAMFIRLLSRFRSPKNVLSASQGELQEVVGPKRAQRIRQYSEVADIGTQERLMAEYDVELITLEDSLYPVQLAEIYDPPLVLFMRGELHEADQHSVAIVGTRRATPYGMRMAEKFGRELAVRGITVISGMADGIDTAAHCGAIEAGGRTIAILGGGVDIVYPASNADLMHKIIRNGCVLSQFPMGMKPSKGHFPYRNRIISGMTLGTLVVEAPLRSGALITARQAAEQGREVFAVPGHVGTDNSLGPHAMIREGAKLTETAEDVLVELDLPADLRQPIKQAVQEDEAVTSGPVHVDPQTKPLIPKVPPRLNVSEVEKDVMSVLSPDGSFVDEIAMACRIPISEALSSLTMLELKGLVRQYSGKRFVPK